MCEREVLAGAELYLCVRTGEVERGPKRSPGTGFLHQRRVVRRSKQHPYILGGFSQAGALKAKREEPMVVEGEATVVGE